MNQAQIEFIDEIEFQHSIETLKRVIHNLYKKDLTDKEIYLINKETEHLECDSYYMEPHSGEVCTGGDWATEYWHAHVRGEVSSYKEWAPNGLIEVKLDEYGSWVEA